MSERQRVSSAARPGKQKSAIRRAIRVGNLVYVAGTTASDEQGNVIGSGDVYAQTAYVLQKIGRALEEVGASFEDVVRTRSFIDRHQPLAGVRAGARRNLQRIRPVSTLVEVSAADRSGAPDRNRSRCGYPEEKLAHPS